MSSQADRRTEPTGSGVPARRGRVWLYAGLLSIQTAGTLVILLNGLPIYRSILFNPAEHKPQPFGSIIVIVVTMQVAHWLGLWIMPILRWRTTIVLAYVVLFLGRLSFVFGAAFFCVAFFVRLPEIDVTPFRVALLLAALFALFCYSSELERLGNALRGA